jgi:hypothetical protein
VVVGNRCFYIGGDEGGEIVDTVNLPDDVIAFLDVVQDGVEACYACAGQFGHWLFSLNLCDRLLFAVHLIE